MHRFYDIIVHTVEEESHGSAHEKQKEAVLARTTRARPDELNNDRFLVVSDKARFNSGPSGMLEHSPFGSAMKSHYHLVSKVVMPRMQRVPG